MRTPTEDRPQQIPWIAFGLAITLSSAIIFALWAASLSNRTAVAVASQDIPAGSQITLKHLRAVEMAIGQGAAYVPIAEVDTLVGHVVRSHVAAGTVFHPDLLAARSEIDSNHAIVGVVLEPGEYPVAHLSSGQIVGLIITSKTHDVDPPQLNQRTNRLTAKPMQAKVVEVTQTDNTRDKALFVSLLAAIADAEPISRAAANGDLRLILLAQDIPESNKK
ncbi:MAG: SAF domain-containing protein [bacterium]|nr:SAF domain-containing protein [bacterium]